MSDTLQARIDGFWDEHIVPTLIDYIRIPNKSPAFDADWAEHGHMEAVLQLALAWLDRHPLPGAEVHVGRLPGRTPLILVEIPGELDGTVLMYGHLDKQPEMEGWSEGLGPWTPVLSDDGKLYGRGGADDGYALFASVCAVQAMIEEGIARPRIVLLIEFSEESGSPDLPAYVEHFKGQVGTPDLVVCLDSGAGDYERLWSTTSLRGLAGGTIRVEVLEEGVHSGDASGIVPSSFRVLRRLLDRIEDAQTGRVIPEALHVEIPESRKTQAAAVAASLGSVADKYPFLPGMSAMGSDPVQQILARTWHPTVSYTGIDGIPAVRSGGNVLRPYTEMKLSVRLPPTADSVQAGAALEAALRHDPPYGCRVTANFRDTADGWNAPDLAPWLERALDASSERRYGKPALHMGEGGTIPFMGMLNAGFPEAQFLITGVLGPASNAHGPNEFLHVPYAKKLTACVVDVLEAFGER